MHKTTPVKFLLLSILKGSFAVTTVKHTNLHVNNYFLFGCLSYRTVLQLQLHTKKSDRFKLRLHQTDIVSTTSFFNQMQ